MNVNQTGDSEQFRFSLSVAGVEQAFAEYTGVTPHTEVEFGFRSNPIQNQTIQVDNFTAPETIPEPSAALLGGLGLLGLAGIRRRG